MTTPTPFQAGSLRFFLTNELQIDLATSKGSRSFIFLFHSLHSPFTSKPLVWNGMTIKEETKYKGDYIYIYIYIYIYRKQQKTFYHKMCVCVCESHSVASDSLLPYGL